MNAMDFQEIAEAFPLLTQLEGAPIFIYGLVDPDSGDVRYIGKSIRPVERLSNHMNESSQCHRSHWLQSLRAQGKRPGMVLFERIEGEWPWQESERFWIAHGRAQGWPLTNNTSGGDGVPGLPAETRARMAAVWKGRKHKPESIEKMRVASASKRHSDETKARMSAAQTGRKITWIDKIAARIRKFTPEQLQDVQRRLDAGELGIALAREFGVHRTTISKIKTGTYYGK